MTLVAGQTIVPAYGMGRAIGLCPPDQVPVGQLEQCRRGEPGDALHDFRGLGTAQSYAPVDGQSDGRYPPPSGIARDAVNLTGAAQVLHILTYCASLANAELLIYSTPAPPGADFVAFAPVPDASDFVGMTVGGGTPASTVTLDFLGRRRAHDLRDSFPGIGACRVVRQGRLRAREGLACRDGDRARRDRHDHRPQAGRAAATDRRKRRRVLQRGARPLFHYRDLSGNHRARLRRVSGLGRAPGRRSGPTRPAVRGVPAANPCAVRTEIRRPASDSHFYSANPGECFATLAGFRGSWLLEASEVFEMDVPDTATGACPAGGVPIYRVWNNRPDSNHRYATTLALRNQMVARGYVAEGYRSERRHDLRAVVGAPLPGWMLSTTRRSSRALHARMLRRRPHATARCDFEGSRDGRRACGARRGVERNFARHHLPRSPRATAKGLG